MMRVNARNGRRALAVTTRRLATQTKAQAVSRVRGTRDLLPEDAEQHQHVVRLLQQTVERYGFRHVHLPILQDATGRDSGGLTR